MRRGVGFYVLAAFFAAYVLFELLLSYILKKSLPGYVKMHKRSR